MKDYNLHSYIKKICVIKNLTFAQIAKKAGMSVQNLSGILNNNNLTLATLNKIAEATGCKVNIDFEDSETGKKYEL